MKNEWTQTERLKFDILDDMTVPIEMLIEGCIYQTSSVLYRNGLISVWPEYFNTFAFSDWPLEILLAERGRMRLLAECDVCLSHTFWRDVVATIPRSLGARGP
jgi:hypothetical protein